MGRSRICREVAPIRENAMTNPSPPRQLALALSFEESFAREDFLVGPANAAVLDLVDHWPDWPSRTMVVVGAEGSGKSHLAAIWAQVSGARFVAARTLGQAAVPRELATGALVLEDMRPGQFDERAVFHLLNLVRETEAYLLITAASAPAAWDIRLPDLASRLRALPVIALDAPDDSLLRAVLIKLFADRHVTVEESLIAFLISRMERSFAAARVLVDALDREALRQKRPLTRALAAELMRSELPRGSGHLGTSMA
jgi:chromosomal replication initiation ATPase DnaA